MTRMFSLAAAVLGAALTLAIPAWGQTLPDAFERAVASELGSAGTDLSPAVMPDAFERTVASDVASGATTVYADAFERAAAAGQQGVSTTGFPPDAVERMLMNRSGWLASANLADHNARVALTEYSAPRASTAASGREIEWSKIGIGVGLGVLLVLGLVLGMRVAKVRPLAH